MRRLPRLFALVAAVLFMAPGIHAQGAWEVVEETRIAGNITGAVSHGHIFKTRTGNVYELTDYVHLYEYEYSPSVTVLRNGSLYKLIVDGFDDPLMCRKLESDTPRAGPPAANAGAAPGAIESVITGEFEGLNQGNIYKLANGQVWEQTEAWIWVWIWVMPRVQIWQADGVYKMKVEKIDRAVTVRRLQ